SRSLSRCPCDDRSGPDRLKKNPTRMLRRLQYPPAGIFPPAPGRSIPTPVGPRASADRSRPAASKEARSSRTERAAAAGGGAVEAEALLEDVLLRGLGGDGEVLPQAGEVHEARGRAATWPFSRPCRAAPSARRGTA